MFTKADAYERFMGRWSRLLAPALVSFATVRDGDEVLDVGAGTGSLTRALRDVITSGRVVAVEPSQEFVHQASQELADSGVHFAVGDAQALNFPDASFDKTVSALVLHFIPDPSRGLQEMIRVTRAGGVVAAAVWDYGGGMEMLRAFWDEAAAADPSVGPRDEAHMQLSAQGALAALWRQEGLENVQEAELTVPLHFESFDDYWGPFLLGQGPAGAYVTSLSMDRQIALERRLRKRLGDAPDRPIDLQARAWAVKGTVTGGMARD